MLPPHCWLIVFDTAYYHATFAHHVPPAGGWFLICAHPPHPRLHCVTGITSLTAVNINGGAREYTLNGKQLSQTCGTIAATVEYLANGEPGAFLALSIVRYRQYGVLLL